MKIVDQYIGQFPEHVQEILKRIRAIILNNSPGVEEHFAYGMPAYKLNQKPLVYFAAFKNHIGLYAMPSGHLAFQKELEGYKQGKGSVQFPFDAPIPFELIESMVQFRVEENMNHAKKPK